MTDRKGNLYLKSALFLAATTAAWTKCLSGNDLPSEKAFRQ
jgi:hypothetical protein